MKPNFNARNQIMDMTENKLIPVINNVYKESLRQMLHVFSNIYYIDGNGNRVKVKCSHGNPERVAGRLKADNTLILPMITIVEKQTVNSEERRRYRPIIINESYWDPNKKRAIRIVSLAPRPINIIYEINVWCKYKADLDMIRSGVFSLFNPDLNIRTKYSDFNKGFLVSERDMGNVTVGDTNDRVLQKSMEISLETYIPNPKFQFTSTGEIREVDFNFEYRIDES